VDSLIDWIAWLCLIPVVGGSLFGILCFPAAWRYVRKQAPAAWMPSSGASPFAGGTWPAVTVLKPVYGVEKDLQANLRTICLQDYPEYQVVFCVQRPNDPAIPLVQELQKEFGADRVAVVIKNLQAGMNGKVNNLLGGLTEARHDVLVISDSDIRVRPDYLKAVVAPLADPEVGCVCTPFKAVNAQRWYEKLELLSMNADFTPSVMFALATGAANYSNGQSITIRRERLAAIGGLESLGEYLVEDYEIGRRIWNSGKRMAVPAYFIEATVDLKSAAQWWSHQVYWDQNTRHAQPEGFFATVLTRAIPFAALFALLRVFDPMAVELLAVVVAVRLVTAAGVLAVMRDEEGLACLWLLPLRDVIGLVSWALAFTQRTVTWRGAEFVLTREGRLVPREAR
jgi:ceramide glucosyltransferase